MVLLVQDAGTVFLGSDKRKSAPKRGSEDSNKVSQQWQGLVSDTTFTPSGKQTAYNQKLFALVRVRLILG